LIDWNGCRMGISRSVMNLRQVKPFFETVLLFLGFGLIGAPLHADDFQTRDGKKQFKGATVTRVEWDGISVTTDSGIEKIPFDNLPDETRAKYHLTAEKLAQYQKALRDAPAKQAAMQAQKADLRHTEPKPRDSLTSDELSAAKRSPVIEAKELMALYENNELSADQNIKGKIGPIRGTMGIREYRAGARLSLCDGAFLAQSRLVHRGRLQAAGEILCAPNFGKDGGCNSESARRPLSMDCKRAMNGRNAKQCCHVRFCESETCGAGSKLQSLLSN
jgi:hypothetical protein